MAYIDCYNLGENSQFRARLSMAFLAYAKIVFEEPDTTLNHVKRLDQAVKTINNPRMYADRYAPAAAVALNGLPEAQVQDAHLDSLVVQFWDRLAFAPQPV